MINTKKLLFALFVFSILACSMPVVLAQSTEIVFRETEWVHVSVGGNTICSIAWEQYDEDVQLVFYAYNDTGLSWNEVIIDANRSESDPFNKFQVLWEGNITAEDKIRLILSSTQGQITTIKEKFGGEISFGRPGTNYEHRVITNQGEVMDVFIDDEHECSFEWTYETVDNETVPLLTVYSANGEVDSTGIMTTTYTSVVEFFDQVGFMFERMDKDDGYVKWLLYSGYELQVRISQGFGSKPLPFFKVTPADNEVYPGDLVTVEFVLPEGVTEYEASWDDKQISEHIRLVEVNSYQDQHEVTFKFKDSAKNQKFTIKVKCEKYGTTYQSKEKVTVLIPIIESLLWLIVGVPLFVLFLIIFIFKILAPRIREDTSSHRALKEST